MPMSLAILNKHKEDKTVFIETGTCEGEAVGFALQAGFYRIYSVESMKKLYDACVKKFAGKSSVRLFFGDSSDKLGDMITEAKRDGRNFLFWLDAHYSEDPNQKPSGDTCPLLKDIATISKKCPKGSRHTLMIDDMRYFDAGGIPLWNNIKTKDIMDALSKSFASISTSRENSKYAKNDIMVVKIIV